MEGLVGVWECGGRSVVVEKWWLRDIQESSPPPPVGIWTLDPRHLARETTLS